MGKVKVTSAFVRDTQTLVSDANVLTDAHNYVKAVVVVGNLIVTQHFSSPLIWSILLTATTLSRAKLCCPS